MKPEAPEVAFQRWLRIQVAAWAYAYEFENTSLVPDDVYDFAARMIDPKIKTGHKIMDKFFATQFEPDTGMWIHQHPERDRLPRIVKLQRDARALGKYDRCQTIEAFCALPRVVKHLSSS